MRVAICVWTKVVPRFWGCRSNGGESKGWRWRMSGKFFVLCDSERSCLVVDGGVRSGGPMDRRGRERMRGGTEGVTGRGTT